MSLFLPLLLAFLAAAPTPGAQSPNSLAIFNDLPISEINIDLPEGENEEEVRRLLGIAVGSTFSRQALRVATLRLYNSGRFEYIDINAGRQGNGVTLLVTLKAKRYIEDIAFIGLFGKIDERQLRNSLAAKIGDEIDLDTYDSIASDVLTFLHKRGYYAASVNVKELSIEHNSKISLGVFVYIGEPTIIKKIAITGTPALDSAVLLRAMKSKPDIIYDSDILASDLENLLKAYRAKGFLESTIGEPDVLQNDALAEINIPINAGRRIKFAFNGNTVLSDSYLISLLKLRSGEALNRTTLENFLSSIKESYLARGYYQVELKNRIDLTSDNTSKIYTIDIIEGPYLPVSKVFFLGQEYFTHRFLEEELFAQMRELAASSIMGQLLDSDDEARLTGPTIGRENNLGGESGHPHLNKPSILSLDPTHVYIAELYEKGLQHLTGIYRTNGFLKVKINSPRVEMAPDGKTLLVFINIAEGTQTIVNNVTISGKLSAKEEALFAKTIALRPGVPLSETAIEESREAILDYYSSRGHIYAGVNINSTLYADNTLADVQIEVIPGPKVRVGMIIIQGRHHIRQRVILAQMTLKSGDVFTPEQARRSRQYLIGLGVFSMANIELVEPSVPAPQKDIVVKITERPRQNLGAGVGLSTEDGIRASIQYSHLNLFGIALGLSTSIKLNRQFFFSLYGVEGEQMARRYQQYEPFTEALERQILISLNAPYVGFLPRAISLTLSLLNERDNTLSYSLDSSSAILGISYKPRRQLAVQLEQSIVYNSLQCVTGDDCSNPVDDRGNIKRIDAGTYTLYKIIPRLKLDFRDNSFNPHRGFWSNMSVEYSHGIGKPISFFKLEGQFSFYIPASDRLTIAIATNIGQIFNLGSSFPISDSFFFGGRSSVRGYFERSIIPADVCVLAPDGHAIYQGGGCNDTLYAIEQSDGSYYVQTKGGRTYGVLRLEGRLRLYGQLSLGLFADLGNLVMDFPALFTTPPRFGVGFGLRYETPLGPLALDFGFDPFPRRSLGEGIFQLHFSIGLF